MAICAASIAIVPEPQHGIVERAALARRAAPAGGGEHRRGERLLERRVALVLAPAALEQRLARAVDVDRGALGADVQDDAQVGPHRVDVRPLAVLVAHPVADGVLDAQGGEVEALQRAALRGGVDAQRLARRDPVGPGDAEGERVEVVLVAVRALGDLDQHPLREPALEVEHHHLVRVAGERRRRRARRAAARRAAGAPSPRRAGPRRRRRREGTGAGASAGR